MVQLHQRPFRARNDLRQPLFLSHPRFRDSDKTYFSRSHNAVGLGAEDIDQRYFIPLFIRPNWVIQGDVFTRFLQTVKVNKYFALDTTIRKCS